MFCTDLCLCGFATKTQVGGGGKGVFGHPNFGPSSGPSGGRFGGSVQHRICFGVALVGVQQGVLGGLGVLDI